MIGHKPRHRELGPTAKMLRKVRWLRVTHPRSSTIITLDLDLDLACLLPTTASAAAALP